MPDFWALKFATWVASLHSLNWCKTGLLSTKPVAFASEPIRDQPADFQTVAQSHPYTVILQVTKSGLDVVTMNNDWCHMKVGCLVNICMLKVSCRFDLTPLLELQIHSAPTGVAFDQAGASNWRRLCDYLAKQASTLTSRYSVRLGFVIWQEEDRRHISRNLAATLHPGPACIIVTHVA